MMRENMPSAWKLIIEDDAGKQIVVPFTRDIITIGRKEGNTIRLTERNVSRNHARLSKDAGEVLLEDLGSFNGIKLNGDRIEGRVQVHEGDTIQIGDYHLALHAQNGAQANGATTQKAGLPGGGAPPMRGEAAHGATVRDDDEFAGDTQRWEPPANMPGMSAQSVPTQEDRVPVTDEHTERAAAVTARTVESPPPRLGGFAEPGDTERVDLEKLSSGLGSLVAGAPAPAPNPEELEPTVRQAVAPPPITLPPTAPVAPAALAPPASPAPAPGAPQPFMAPPSSNGVHAHSAQLQGNSGTMPISAAMPPPVLAPPAPATLPGPVLVPRTPGADMRRALDEQTDMMRPAPMVIEDLTIPRLVVLNTIFAGSSFPLRAAEAVIGRTEENDITIEHKSVSRNHAKVVREGDRVRILDLKSANGVLVNDEEVEAAVLRPGDVVELGRVRLRFVPPGERFSVPADEIERARIADAVGDEFDNDTRTGVTNPVRQKQKTASSPPNLSDDFEVPKAGRPVILYAAAGLVALIVVVALVMVLGGGEKPAEEPGLGAGGAVGAVGAVDPDAPRVADPGAIDPAAIDPRAREPGRDPAASGSETGAKLAAAADAPPKAALVEPAAADAPEPALEEPAEEPEEIKEATDGVERPRPVRPRPLEPRRPSDRALEGYKNAGIAAYIRGDWKTAIDEFNKYRRWVKDDDIVNRNLKRAQDELKR
jgi:pSer/pThr/pTyr-binding forkhead associated (FHA) protein